MKVKDEDLRRELQIAINGEDSIASCARRLGIGINRFEERLYRARVHGIESVLHLSRQGTYAGGFKLEVVESVMQGMPKHAAAIKYNLTECVVGSWIRKFVEGGEDALLADNRGRSGKMGRKPKPKLSDYEPGSIEYLKLENEMLRRELLLIKKALPLIQESERRTLREKRSTGTSEN